VSRNLHVTGFCPETTTDALIRELFALHCSVEQVVMKGAYCFVNTADEATATVAKQRLDGTEFNGALLQVTPPLGAGIPSSGVHLSFASPSFGR
jgi:hypothetical protein